MAYAQIDVSAPRHRKVFPLSDAAFRLWVTSLCWCQEHLTDGAVPRAMLPVLGAPRTGPRLVAELVSAGLWETTADGWRVHDYLHWNTSRAQVEDRRGRWRQRRTLHERTPERTQGTPTSTAPERTHDGTRTDPIRIRSATQEHTQERVCAPPTHAGGNGQSVDRAGQLWDLWREASTEAGRPVRLACSPKEFSDLAAIGQHYADTSDADLKAAMLALWQDTKAPHNLGVLKSRLPDLLSTIRASAEASATYDAWLHGRRTS